MAQGGPAKVDWMKELECAVCLLTVRDHRMLNCQHVFCSECLTPLANPQDILCPVCRTKTLLQPGVAELPKSLMVNKILDTLCERCLEGSRDICYCDKWWCTSCHETCAARKKFEDEAETMLDEWTAQEKWVQEERTRVTTHSNSLTERVNKNLNKLVHVLQVRAKDIKDQIEDVRVQRMKTLDELSQTIAAEKSKVRSSIDQSNVEQIEININKIQKLMDQWRSTLHEKTNEVRASYTHVDYTEVPDPNLTENVTSALGRPVVTPVDYHSMKVTTVTFGSKGSDNGQFDGPTHIAISPKTNNIIVTDVHNDQLQIFNNKNQYICKFGSKGNGPGQFEFGGNANAGGVGVTSENHIVIADTFNHRLQVLTERGEHIRSIGSRGKGQRQFDSPRGLAIHMDHIYVSDSGNQSIKVFEIRGSFVRAFGSSDVFSPGYPLDVAVCPNGQVVVAVSHPEYDGKLVLFTKDGSYKATLGTGGLGSVRLHDPLGVTADNLGNITVSDIKTHQVHVLTDSGQLLRSFGSYGNKPGKFRGPVGVVCTQDGRVYVVDCINNRVQIFSFT